MWRIACNLSLSLTHKQIGSATNHVKAFSPSLSQEEERGDTEGSRRQKKGKRRKYHSSDVLERTRFFSNKDAFNQILHKGNERSASSCYVSSCSTEKLAGRSRWEVSKRIELQCWHLFCNKDTFPNNDGKILSYLVSIVIRLFHIQSKVFLCLDDPWILLFPMIYKFPFTYVVSWRN